MINIFLGNLDKAIDVYNYYEIVLLVGYFNVETSEVCLDSFPYQHELKNLAKEKACFKNVSDPSYIDLSSTNNGLYKITRFSLDSFKKKREIHQINYKKFGTPKFNTDLKNEFAHEKIESCIMKV